MRRLMMFMILSFLTFNLGVLGNVFCPSVIAGKHVEITEKGSDKIVLKTDSARKAYVNKDTIIVKMIDGKVKKYYPESDYIYKWHISFTRFTVDD